MPILADCREPKVQCIPDMRGPWLAFSGLEGQFERIKQYGDRTVDITAGAIHNFHADGTLANLTRDAERPRSGCMNTRGSIGVDEHEVVNFRPFILPYTIVRRWMENGGLNGTDPTIDGVTPVRRICKVPANQLFSCRDKHCL